MSESLTEPLAHTLALLMARHPRVELAILFGSMASGTARPDSDIDLAVGSDTPLSQNEKAALIADLAESLGRPVDLIDLGTIGEPLLGQVLRHGRRLIGSDEHFAGLLSRHLFEMADFFPYRSRILTERRQAWIGR